ncbi:MAG: type III pantothenate kinase, partial [Candidatus Omnitrophica bacterium]|nr:type III pantothenate kinase [Candidatus Omnitrophota bacterium]
VIAIDFGTAVTMDFVNVKREYEGGLIFPGLRLAMGALTEDTALLPVVTLKQAVGFIGRDTHASMNNGILLGYAAMCDGLIQKFRKKYGKGVKVVATGGDAALVAKHSRYIKKIYPDLIFEGLRRFYDSPIAS